MMFPYPLQLLGGGETTIFTQDDRLVLVNLRTLKPIHSFDTPLEVTPVFVNRPQLNFTHLIGVSSDERYAVTGDTGRWILVWDLKNKKLHKKIRRPDDDRGLNYDPIKNQIVIWSARGDSEIWNATTGGLTAKIVEPEKIDIKDLNFFKGGTKILQWSYDGVSKIFNAANGKQLIRIDHSLPILGVSLSIDQRNLVSYGDYGIAEVWDVTSGKPLARVYHGGSLEGASLYRKNRFLLSWGGDGTAKMWDVKQAKEIGHVRHINNQNLSIASLARRAKPVKISVAKYSDSAEDVAEEKRVTTFGWGKTRPVAHFEPSSILRVLSLNVLSTQECLKLGGWEAKELDKNVFCAYAPYRKTCFGDSGSPVMGKDSVVGIVSWGSGLCGEDNKPSVYTRVHPFAKWIDETIHAPNTTP